MPHRERLLKILAQHAPSDTDEARDVARIDAFVRANADCFGRSNRAGHITGSAFVVDPAGRVLLTHHAKLERWLQVGGHSDPHEHNPAVTALREAREESGLEDLVLVETRPLDIDAHRIPARRGEPAHDHLDFRYVVRTRRPDALVVSAESHELRWFGLAELTRMPFDDALHRAVGKLRTRFASC